MKYDIVKRHRRSIRLKGFDYRQAGGYFVTIVTKDRLGLFGEIVDGEVRLNDAGRIIQTVWNDLPNHYPDVQCDAFVVMPNHVHGIIVLVGAGLRACPQKGQPQGVAPTMSLTDVVHRFKTLTTNQYIHGVKRSGWMPFSGRLWQRNYYERVVRDENELTRVREYIANNPMQWDLDRENPLRLVNKSTGKAEPWEV